MASIGKAPSRLSCRATRSVPPRLVGAWVDGVVVHFAFLPRVGWLLSTTLSTGAPAAAGIRSPTPRPGARRIATRASASSSPEHAPRRARRRDGKIYICAKWSLDAKFGHKASALEMLGEWVHTVGVAAGLDPDAVAIYTGAVGTPESRVELHVSQFANLEELDGFFSAIPGEQHVAWGKRFAEHVVDGSPVWHVMRAVPIRAPAGSPAAAAELTLKTIALDDDAAAAAAAVEEHAARTGFSMPAKVAPRAPKRISAEQASQPVFSADDFGEGDTVGALVFPSSTGDNDVLPAVAGDGARSDAVAESANAALAAALAEVVAKNTTKNAAKLPEAANADDDVGFNPLKGLSDGPFGDVLLTAEDINLDDYPPGSKIVTDWKGEPMVITPGDRIPGIM